MKLSKKEIKKIEKQMKSPPDRGPTWVGYRSTTINEKHKDPKFIRRQTKDMINKSDYDE